jgi:hypothetical protein
MVQHSLTVKRLREVVRSISQWQAHGSDRQGEISYPVVFRGFSQFMKALP